MLTPILGVDVMYDVGAAAFVGWKWLKYTKASRAPEAAGGTDPAEPVSAPKPRSVLDDCKILAYYFLGAHAHKEEKHDQALVWLKRAAQAGSEEAMDFIGKFYLFGYGVSVDLKAAAYWFEQAIIHGERERAPGHLYHVSAELMIGKVTPQDLPECFRLSLISAEAGYAEAQWAVGWFYRYGRGGAPVDRVHAREWFNLAAAHGDSRAKQELEAIEEEDRSGRSNQNERGSRASSGRLSVSEALELLELTDQATKAEMRSAYMRLMQQVHPDKGGSNFFAKQLNEAREVLGF